MKNLTNYEVKGKRNEVWEKDGEVFVREGNSSEKFGNWRKLRDLKGTFCVSRELDEERQEAINLHREKQLTKHNSKKVSHT